MLNETKDEYVSRKVTEMLRLLAQHLEPADTFKVAEVLMRVLSKTTNREELLTAGDTLAALVSHLALADSKQITQRTINTLLARLHASDLIDYLVVEIDPLCDKFDPNRNDLARLSVIDRIACWDTSREDSWNKSTIMAFESLNTLITNLTTPAALAHVLRHPQCVGPYRRAALDRLEALAFPPTPVERALHLQAALAPAALAPVAAGQHVHRRTHRRFHTVWDAVAWLEREHPEIDLTGPFKPVPLPLLPK